VSSSHPEPTNPQQVLCLKARASGDLRQMDLVVPFILGGLDACVDLGIDDEDAF
jgi:hypothetical protein